MPIVDDSATDEKSFAADEPRDRAWLDTHPEVTARIPGWADNVEFDLGSTYTGTVIECTRRVGPLTMRSQVKVSPDGSVLADGHVHLSFPAGAEFSAHTPWQGMMTARGLASHLEQVAQILGDEGLA